MKTIRHYQQVFALFFAGLMVLGITGCYSRRQIQTSRLSRISAKSLQYIVVDPGAPQTAMWLLSNVITEDAVLIASIERATPEFVQKFYASGKKGHRNYALLYVRPEVIKTYTDTPGSTRLNFTDITRIEVVEPDAGKVVGLVLACIAFAAGVGSVIILSTLKE